MKYIYLIILLFVVGCSVQPQETDQRDDTTTAESGMKMRMTAYTLNNVADHASEGDCWLVIDGMVYDVSDFVASHPGGIALLEGCGRDASELYESRPMGSGTPHSAKAKSMLTDYYIGDLV
ncbi:hypothetical protein K9M79_08825 [Candidatus Woesearchaeota archaeon]|nr:hypothetical protein [Candidatus Woesearchaeota archaeon]